MNTCKLEGYWLGTTLPHQFGTCLSCLMFFNCWKYGIFTQFWLLAHRLLAEQFVKLSRIRKYRFWAQKTGGKEQLLSSYHALIKGTCWRYINLTDRTWKYIQAFLTWSNPILSCIDVCDLPILQNTEPNIKAEAIDILARTLFVGPSREAYSSIKLISIIIDPKPK